MARWEAFFAAQLAAAATLAGLLFVGVSLNLTKILDNPSLPGRALSGFYLLLANLIVASLMLVPDQPSTASGLEILIIGLALWGMVSRLDVGAIRRSTAEYRRYFVRHFFMFQLAVIPYLVAGVLVLAGAHGGLYWLAAAMVISLFVASTEAWVLLVEINR
jgi:modulator of FtsH protease